MKELIIITISILTVSCASNHKTSLKTTGDVVNAYDFQVPVERPYTEAQLQTQEQDRLQKENGNLQRQITELRHQNDLLKQYIEMKQVETDNLKDRQDKEDARFKEFMNKALEKDKPKSRETLPVQGEPTAEPLELPLLQ